MDALPPLKGIFFEELSGYASFEEHKNALICIVNRKYDNHPIIANMTFGHTSPSKLIGNSACRTGVVISGRKTVIRVFLS
jgi:muramoyltetrapeptide carboxypeptidase LdcA involved in peptidoglycan recycling